MQKLILSGAIFVFAAVCAAQSPLTTVYTSNNGNAVGGAVYFDLTVNTPISVTQFDVNTSAAVGAAVSINVYVRPCDSWVGNVSGGAAGWTLASSGAGLSAGNNLPTACPMATPFTLDQGNWAVAVQNVNTNARYTGTGTSAGPTVFSNAELTLTAGGSSNVLFSGTPFTPRVFNGSIYYTTVPGSVLNCGLTSEYGEGCYSGAKSWYEAFATLSAFDLAGAPAAENVLVLTNLNNVGWNVAAGSAAWFTPAAAAPNVLTAAGAAMGDDSISGALTLGVPLPLKGGASTAVVHACSNGFLILGSTTLTTGDFSPTVAELLNTANQNRLCPMWADLHAGRNVTTNPASGIYFDVDPANSNLAYITWLDVGEFANSTAGTTSISFQVCLDSATGNAEFRYRTVTLASGTSACIVGHSQGQVGGVNSRNPGNRDITAAIPFATNGPDAAPLGLRRAGVQRPVLGSTFNLETFDIPATSGGVFNVLALAAVIPGVDLGGIGAPGCKQHIALTGSSTTFLVGAPTVSLGVGIPNDPTLKGLSVFSQSVALVAGVNPAGLLVSNGVRIYVGSN